MNLLFLGGGGGDRFAARACVIRALQLLRTGRQRADYLLAKSARVVAMTCTHAAMTRRQLVELGFKYDSIVMEEAAQVLEVETLIPMLLQVRALIFSVVDRGKLLQYKLIHVPCRKQSTPVPVSHVPVNKVFLFSGNLF